jgi:serine/threonine-protein kinase
VKPASSGSNALADASAKSRTCSKCGAQFGEDALFCPNDGTPLATRASGADDPYIGRELEGHIELRSLAGVGAMGRVYRAYQKGVDRDVAVKVLHRELSANQQLVTRFHREAKVASRLAHPNVVHVHLAGQLPDGALYIVMEYLDGISLQSALAATGGAMELPRALHIALQLCDAVGEAHAQGVVHRDLKPENVMLVRRGADPDFVKVLDFGIARIEWGEQSMATAAGLIFGTARYISPEGAQGEPVGSAGDVYAMATLLYQMLAGRTPFEGEQAVALLVQQIHDAPPPLKSIPRAAYVPEPIAEVVMRNLQKRPAARDSDGRAFGRALLDAARAAGLAVDEIVGSPLLGMRPSAVKLAPIEPTKQLDLDRATQDRLARAVSGVPSQENAGSEPVRRPSSPPITTEKLEETLDDADAPPPPMAAPSAPNALSRTQIATPLPMAVAPSAPSFPVVAHRASVPSAPAYAPAPPEWERESGEGLPQAHVRTGWTRTRAALLFLSFFLVGAGGATFAAYRMGLFAEKTPTADALVKQLDDAILEHRWDSPPGDNVMDLLERGRAAAPQDPRFTERARKASDEITKQAVGEWTLGSKPEAVRMLRLAVQLDPADASAAKLLADYERQLAGTATLPPLEAGAPVAPTGTRPSPTVAVPSGPRAAVDVSPGAPRVGQSVDLVARATLGNGAAPKAPVADGAFELAGPGIAPGTRLPAALEGVGTCRASFTFLGPGRFVVTFVGRVDGSAVRSTRTIDVAPQGGTPPLPSATGKWM